MPRLRIVIACFAVSFVVCLGLQACCSALMAETVEIQCSDPCPSCEMSCETPAVLERLDALLARECPDCVCPAVESAPADTAPGNGESVKEHDRASFRPRKG